MEVTMATNPIDRAEDKQSAESLEERIASIGRNVSPEHRAILERGLRQVSSRTFNEALARMPNVGLDSDFEPRRE
jgi:antitoxin FitA